MSTKLLHQILFIISVIVICLFITAAAASTDEKAVQNLQGKDINDALSALRSSEFAIYLEKAVPLVLGLAVKDAAERLNQSEFDWIAEQPIILYGETLKDALIKLEEQGYRSIIY